MVANLKFLVWKGQKRARVEDTLFGTGERRGAGAGKGKWDRSYMKRLMKMTGVSYLKNKPNPGH